MRMLLRMKKLMFIHTFPQKATVRKNEVSILKISRFFRLSLHVTSFV
nr:MAG TPA: hypothetical protein [Caudoviricetes sp.]